MNEYITNFSQKIIDLGFKSYEEYLNSDIWQNFRKRYFKSRRRKHCMCCRTPNFEVELHHLTYDRLGKERLADVVPLCREHHEAVHEILKQQYNNDIRWSERIVALLAPRRSSRRKGLLPRSRGRGRRARDIKRGGRGSSDCADD